MIRKLTLIAAVVAAVLGPELFLFAARAADSWS